MSNGVKHVRPTDTSNQENSCVQIIDKTMEHDQTIDVDASVFDCPVEVPTPGSHPSLPPTPIPEETITMPLSSSSTPINSRIKPLAPRLLIPSTPVPIASSTAGVSHLLTPILVHQSSTDSSTSASFNEVELTVRGLEKDDMSTQNLQRLQNRLTSKEISTTQQICNKVISLYDNFFIRKATRYKAEATT